MWWKQLQQLQQKQQQQQRSNRRAQTIEESFPFLLCAFHIFGVGLLHCKCFSSLPSGPTVNHSRCKHSKFVLHKIIWHPRIITLLPWTSDRTSANATEARGTCVGKGFSLSSLFPEGRDKNGRGIWNSAGDMEHWSACHSAARQGQLYAEIRNESSPLLFQLSIPKNYSTFILDECAAHDFHPEPTFNVKAWNSVTFI